MTSLNWLLFGKEGGHLNDVGLQSGSRIPYDQTEAVNSLLRGLSFECSVVLKIEHDKVCQHGMFRASVSRKPRSSAPMSSLQSVPAIPPSKQHSKLYLHMQKTCQGEFHLGSFILYPLCALKIQSSQLLGPLHCNCPMTLLLCSVSNPTFLRLEGGISLLCLVPAIPKVCVPLKFLG